LATTEETKVEAISPGPITPQRNAGTELGSRIVGAGILMTKA
jgi:hypothetical protein